MPLCIYKTRFEKTGHKNAETPDFSVVSGECIYFGHSICERVEVERRFSLAKRKCGMGLVTAKLRETAAHAFAISILVLNLRKIQRALLKMLAYLLEILAQNKNWALVQ